MIGTNLQVTDNVGYGIFAEQLRLNGEARGIDPFSRRRPLAVNSTCGKSLGPDGPWGICTGDAGSPSGAFADVRETF